MANCPRERAGRERDRNLRFGRRGMWCCRTPFGATPMPTESGQETQSAPTDPQAREAWFSATPDPWREIVRLAYGGDRSFATTVERIVINAEPAQRPAMEEKLLAALRDRELTDAGRVFVCRMLGLIGSRACVAEVAKLVGDDRTADVARMALDRIAEPAVDEAYRGALGKLSGAAKAGLIGSIGGRGDARALEMLKAIAGNEHESAPVRKVAGRAVQRIEAKA